MEEVLCAMALKSADGRQKHQAQTGLRVCCERALKSAGERNTHGGAGAGAGAFGEPPARERRGTSGWRGEALRGVDGGDLAVRLSV
jgi:hypothetical protein